MSFWGNIGGKILSSATGGLYNPGAKGPKLPKGLKPEKTGKRVVGKKQQAGGGQIHFNTEESYTYTGEDPEKMKLMNVKGEPKNQRQTSTGKGSLTGDDIVGKPNYYNVMSRINPSNVGLRSEAAKRLKSGGMTQE